MLQLLITTLMLLSGLPFAESAQMLQSIPRPSSYTSNTYAFYGVNIANAAYYAPYSSTAGAYAQPYAYAFQYYGPSIISSYSFEGDSSPNLFSYGRQVSSQK